MNDRLASFVENIHAKVPFYRERLADWDQRSKTFEEIPLLSKADIAGRELALCPAEVNLDSLVEETTSGSTGLPLHCYKSKRHRLELAIRLWQLRGEYADITPRDRMAEFYAFIQEGSRFRSGDVELDMNGQSMCLSMLDLSPDKLRRYYHALCDYQPRWFFSVPSALTVLAEYMLDHGLTGRPTGIGYIEVNGETLFPYQKEKIQRAFECPVLNHYGCREFWLMAMSCPHGRLHLETDFLHVEAIPVERGRHAELVVTSLRNESWPLIRYRVGDRVSTGFRTCTCGRRGPVVSSIKGRTTDYLVIGDWVSNPILFHYMVTLVNETFGDAVRQFQITQETENHLRFRYVRGLNWSSQAEEVLWDELRQRLPGHSQLTLEAMEAIPFEGRKFTYFKPYSRGGDIW